jgi:hypothetical protein
MEAMRTIAEIMQPVAFGADEIGFDAIAEVAPGGHFFAIQQTMEVTVWSKRSGEPPRHQFPRRSMAHLYQKHTFSLHPLFKPAIQRMSVQGLGCVKTAADGPGIGGGVFKWAC